MKDHQEDIKNNEINSVSDEDFSKIWWLPIVNCLESSEKVKKGFIYEVKASINFKLFQNLINLKLWLKYVLTRIMRAFPDGIAFCQKISSIKFEKLWLKPR